MIENFATNCTAPQDGEKIFKTLRDWSESEYQDEMAFLGIDDSNMSWERKKILVILYMLSGVKDKEGWFYIDNANLSEICKVGERTITRVKRDFERLGIIKIKRGYQGSPTRYKFFEKKLNKLPKISKKTPESTLAALAGKNVIPANKNKVYKSVIDSLLSSCVQVPANIDSKKIEKKFILEGGVQYKEKEQYKDKEEYKDKNQDIEQYKDKEGYEEGLMIGKIYNNIIKELVEVLVNKLDKISNSIDNNTRVQSEANTKVIESINTMVQAMVNTKDETIEELKKISTSIENNSRVNSNVIEEKDKIIEEKDKIIEELQGKLQSSSMEYSSKSNGEIQPSIDDKDETNDKVDNTPIESSTVQSESNSKVIEESDNSKDVKESSSNSNGEVQDPSSSNIDKILSHQLDVVSKDPIKDKAWEREQQKKVDTKTASKTTVQESNSNESERSYALNKLKYEIVEPFKRKIINSDSYEKLMATQEEFGKTASGFYTTYNDVITQSEIKSFINEVRIVFQQKEEELTPKADANETPSKSNGIVQESSKEDEASKRFQPNKEATPKVENREEKKETTTEPTTADSKNIEVPNADTSDSKEEQEKLDDELDKMTSSFFSADANQKTSTKESEEVKFPETRVIPLREGEQRQVQELLSNQTINALLKDYSPFGSKKTYIEILTEIRKVATKEKYIQRVVQAYLNEIESKGYYCNVEDAMKPLDDSKEEKETTAENNHQDNEESNSCQLEEEKMAMAAACSHDETQDAEF